MALLKNKLNISMFGNNEPPKYVLEKKINNGEDITAPVTNLILEKANIKKIKRKIEEFRRLNLNRLSQEYINNKIRSIFSIDNQIIIIPTIHRKIPKNHFAYRVRYEDDLKKEITTFDDLWAPPAKVTKIGRLNIDKFPMFYASRFPDIAIEECKITDDRKFLLTRYIAKNDIPLVDLSNVDIDKVHSNLGDKGKEFMHLLNDFIEVELTRDVGVGTEYLYKLSNAIVSTLYSLKSEHGWVYPSVCNRHDINMCLTSKAAKSSFAVCGSFIASVSERTEDGRIKTIKLHEAIDHDNMVDKNKVVFYTLPDNFIDPVGDTNNCAEIMIRELEIPYEDELDAYENKNI